MLAAALIVFREVLEAGLIVGIILAATEGVAGRGRWIASGVAAGIVGACIVAAFAQSLAQAFAGAGQNVFNATILIAAVAMLSWHILWMSGHARTLTADLKALGRSVTLGERTLLAMSVVVAVAVLREGAEVVLFLYGIAASGGGAPLAMLSGGVLGVGGGAFTSWLLYRGLVAIPIGRLFSVTNALVALLAAGMAAQAAGFLAQASILPSLGDQVWDTSALLRDDAIIGRVLHTLVGYVDRPMGVQVVAYLVVLLALAGLSRLVSTAPRAMAPRAT
ncbi:MAG: FTR1 family protein [Proteobacteria bacterium]|nr:FTR1 family protein [Pseudomonadota bacterium]